MKKIIAVDFDGCLVKHEYPNIGKPILETVNALLAEQERGASVILWTCRKGEELREAVEWCEANGIKLDAVNENISEMVEYFNGDTRKVYADEYWDDRGRRMPPSNTDVCALQKALQLMEHYAKLLNMYDGGKRIESWTVEKWKRRNGFLHSGK
jgi:hypothetical protein